MNYKGRIYCLTKVRFKLNFAPKVMVTILKTILGRMTRVKRVTTTQMTLVDETEVTALEVIDYLKKFGLNTKPQELLERGTALGLRLKKDKAGDASWFFKGEIRSRN